MSIFDNATQVMIGGKEVQSIITSNGGVLYEKPSGDNYLLTLTSDKDILSYYDNESALLTATLTNNGVGVQGETVRFEGFLLDTPITRSITQNTETQVGSKYIVSNIPITNLNKIFLNKEHTVYITKDAVDGVKIHWPNGGSGDETSNISVENGIITYSRGGTTYTEDCSSYDMSVVYSQVSGFSINDYGVFAVTDSSGVATVSYESKGTGDLNIKVDCMNLQETYVLEDCNIYNLTEHSRSHNSSSAVSNEVISGFNWDNSGDWVVSFDMKVTNFSQRIDIVPPTESLNHHLGLGKPSNRHKIRVYFGKAEGGEEYLTSAVTMNNNEYYSIEISKIGVIPHFKINGVELLYSGSDEPISNYYSVVTWLSNYNAETIKFTQWGSGTIYIKNLKVKTL